jgi:hypothetical protein
MAENGSEIKKAPKRWAEEMTIPISSERFEVLQKTMAEKFASLDLHESERESALGKIRDDRNELDRIGRTIASRGEKRMVTLEERYVFETNTVEVVNVDTREVVRVRAMTGDERAAAAQVELPIVVPEQPAAAPAASA